MASITTRSGSARLAALSGDGPRPDDLAGRAAGGDRGRTACPVAAVHVEYRARRQDHQPFGLVRHCHVGHMASREDRRASCGRVLSSEVLHNDLHDRRARPCNRIQAADYFRAVGLHGTFWGL
jgi:hypothetical protein